MGFKRAVAASSSKLPTDLLRGELSSCETTRDPLVSKRTVEENSEICWLHRSMLHEGKPFVSLTLVGVDGSWERSKPHGTFTLVFGSMVYPQNRKPVKEEVLSGVKYARPCIY
jgi:hypothetical protein